MRKAWTVLVCYLMKKRQGKLKKMRFLRKGFDITYLKLQKQAFTVWKNYQPTTKDELNFSVVLSKEQIIHDRRLLWKVLIILFKYSKNSLKASDRKVRKAA
jgi:hypothetical protein